MDLEEATIKALEGKLTELDTIDLDRDDKMFDEALNKFLSGTNSRQDPNENTIRAHGWYYGFVLYQDYSNGIFCFHPSNNMYDASIYGEFVSKDFSGIDNLDELINIINMKLNKVDGQINLKEGKLTEEDDLKNLISKRFDIRKKPQKNICERLLEKTHGFDIIRR